jgi:hypothetical protein
MRLLQQGVGFQVNPQYSCSQSMVVLPVSGRASAVKFVYILGASFSIKSFPQPRLQPPKTSTTAAFRRRQIKLKINSSSFLKTLK